MPAPGYDIAHFYNTATRRGLARNNLYRIKSIGEIFDATDNADLLIYAKDGILPSRAIDTQTVKFKSFDFVVPMAAKYPENTSWNITFYCDKSYVLRGLLESWSRYTFDEHQHVQTQSFNLTDIDIVLLDNSDPSSENRELKEIKTYKLVGTFPVNVGALQYNYGSSGEFVTQQVSIAFQYVITEQSTGNVNIPSNTPAATSRSLLPGIGNQTPFAIPGGLLQTLGQTPTAFTNNLQRQATGLLNQATNLFRGFGG